MNVKVRRAAEQPAGLFLSVNQDRRTRAPGTVWLSGLIGSPLILGRDRAGLEQHADPGPATEGEFMNILLADDDSDMLAIVAASFRSEGFRIFAVLGFCTFAGLRRLARQGRVFGSRSQPALRGEGPGGPGASPRRVRLSWILERVRNPRDKLPARLRGNSCNNSPGRDVG